jgi:hypothetical protein
VPGTVLAAKPPSTFAHPKRMPAGRQRSQIGGQPFSLFENNVGPNHHDALAKKKSPDTHASGDFDI